MIELDLTIRGWENEVNAETIRQIENGESPYLAKNIAEVLVKERRRSKHADKSGG
jgi:hypothetical protein